MLDYPKGTIWIDMSSLKEDGKVDYFVNEDRGWMFAYRDFPIPIIK